jgi:hypothetical protein
MRIIINVSNKKSKAEIESNNQYEPEQYWDTTCSEGSTVHQDKDAISARIRVPAGCRIQHASYLSLTAMAGLKSGR